MYYLAIAVMSLLLLVTSIVMHMEKNTHVTVLLGFGTTLGVIASLYLLHVKLIGNGHPTSALGAVFGDWGREHFYVPAAYCLLFLAGLFMIVLALSTMKKNAE